MTIELELDDIAQGGDGVGRYEGRVIFASGGLPGERVRVQLHEPAALESTKAFLKGEVVEVLRAAPERVEPRLPGASHMSWQHIAYEAQVRFKERILAEQLGKLAGLTEAPLRPMLAAARPWHYRNSATLHVQDERIGYFAAGSRDVVDLAEDPLLLPVMNVALAGLQALKKQEPGTTSHDAIGSRFSVLGARCSQVVLRASESHGYAIGALHGEGDLSGLAVAWRERVPSLAGVELRFAPPRAPRSPSEEPAAPAAPVRLHEEFGGVTFSLGAESFFQTNTAQAGRMLEVVREGLALQPGERLLDAYSGVGAFALPLAAGLAEVTAVEESPQAVADGEYSARLNEIGNVRFVVAPVERALAELEGTFDAVILDPPRRGCHPEALAVLVNMFPARIAYISCHPGILARDLGPLLSNGYRLAWVQPVDMFPQTPHIEAVVLLER